MAHQNGTATDHVDLLDKLRVFALANGWTVHNFGARPAGATAGQALQLSKGGFAFSFLSLSSAGTAPNPGQYVGGYAHDAYVGGSGTENQANASPKIYANAMTGPYQGYDFFAGDGANGPYLYAVVETSAGTFKHFGVGVLDKFGAITTGAFVYAAAWNYDPTNISQWAQPRHSVPFDSTESSSVAYSRSLHVRADSDTITPRWYDPQATPFLRAGHRSASTGFLTRTTVIGSASRRTGRTTLTPCLVSGERTGGLYSLLGAPPGMRWVSLDYLDPGAVLTIGTDTWKVFPVIRKNGGAGQPNSERFGYAFKMN